MGSHAQWPQDQNLYKMHESREASEDEIKNPALVAGGVYV